MKKINNLILLTTITTLAFAQDNTKNFPFGSAISYFGVSYNNPVDINNSDTILGGFNKFSYSAIISGSEFLLGDKKKGCVGVGVIITSNEKNSVKYNAFSPRLDSLGLYPYSERSRSISTKHTLFGINVYKNIYFKHRMNIIPFVGLRGGKSVYNTYKILPDGFNSDKITLKYNYYSVACGTRIDFFEKKIMIDNIKKNKTKIQHISFFINLSYQYILPSLLKFYDDPNLIYTKPKISSHCFNISLGMYIH